MLYDRKRLILKLEWLRQCDISFSGGITDNCDSGEGQAIHSNLYGSAKYDNEVNPPVDEIKHF